MLDVHEDEFAQQLENERQDPSKYVPRTAPLEQVKHACCKDSLNMPICRCDFKRKADAVDIVCDSTQTRGEPIFVEAVPKPCACIQDPSAALNLAHFSHRYECLRKRIKRETQGGGSKGNEKHGSENQKDGVCDLRKWACENGVCGLPPCSAPGDRTGIALQRCR